MKIAQRDEMRIGMLDDSRGVGAPTTSRPHLSGDVLSPFSVFFLFFFHLESIVALYFNEHSTIDIMRCLRQSICTITVCIIGAPTSPSS